MKTLFRLNDEELIQVLISFMGNLTRWACGCQGVVWFDSPNFGHDPGVQFYLLPGLPTAYSYSLDRLLGTVQLCPLLFSQRSFQHYTAASELLVAQITTTAPIIKISGPKVDPLGQV